MRHLTLIAAFTAASIGAATADSGNIIASSGDVVLKDAPCEQGPGHVAYANTPDINDALVGCWVKSGHTIAFRWRKDMTDEPVAGTTMSAAAFTAPEGAAVMWPGTEPANFKQAQWFIIAPKSRRCEQMAGEIETPEMVQLLARNQGTPTKLEYPNKNLALLVDLSGRVETVGMARGAEYCRELLAKLLFLN